MDIQQLPIPPGGYAGKVSVQVKPMGSADVLDATLVTAPPFSVWAVLPAVTPLGPADVTLVVDGQESDPVRIIVVRTNPGIFTKAGSGFGSAVAQNLDAVKPPVLNSLTNPAVPGQDMTLWGTGLGSVQGGEVAVELGGVDVFPSYAGPAPGLVGVDQINFQVPRNRVPEGCSHSDDAAIADSYYKVRHGCITEVGFTQRRT